MGKSIRRVVEGSAYNQVEYGSRPGCELPVFDTDFGRIGVFVSPQWTPFYTYRVVNYSLWDLGE